MTNTEPNDVVTAELPLEWYRLIRRMMSLGNNRRHVLDIDLDGQGLPDRLVIHEIGRVELLRKP